ncbi:MAG: hypothetical protein A2787_09760 [Omnitrophica WOR_2 bacterium RIFCSPHIGHO2_01_FULL_48_9]|nr:MAG: hypothetical protein A3D10_08840 [Omnitrophica WOR_2 bacterium RIFCSPHIGHO2_02_FULL_48_11]OGX32438.1 MAG: hypothetical protein A2787_09760 [Omnitrophica WOR_2 bacterium RIFCSPHIGHO2_01_FULL_48_9]
MSKILRALEQIKDERKEKILAASHDSAIPLGTQPSIAEEDPRSVNSDAPAKSISINVLFVVVISLGVMFMVLNVKVLYELNKIRSSMATLSKTTGSQRGKVNQIESLVSQVKTLNLDSKKELDGKIQQVNTIVSKVQSDVTDVSIESGLLRSKINELNATNKKLVDQYIDLSQEIEKLKRQLLANSQ